MGKPDVVLKQWLGRKEHFADLFNGVIFHGQEMIKAEDLQDLCYACAKYVV